MQYLEEILSDLQFVAHLREEVYVAVIEQQVDEDHALVSGLQEVTENLSVCEHVHHDSEHLNKQTKKTNRSIRRVNLQKLGLPGRSLKGAGVFICF